jgi:small-conductance mechanosensitive channel
VLAIIVVVVLIVAGHLGLDMVALIAALGLGGFAIALALKDTITNIFSGLVIMISRPFAIGDRVDVPRLDAWGDVTDGAACFGNSRMIGSLSLARSTLKAPDPAALMGPDRLERSDWSPSRATG